MTFISQWADYVGTLQRVNCARRRICGIPLQRRDQIELIIAYTKANHWASFFKLNYYSSESKRIREASLNFKHSPKGLRLSWGYIPKLLSTKTENSDMWEFCVQEQWFFRFFLSVNLSIRVVYLAASLGKHKTGLPSQSQRRLYPVCFCDPVAVGAAGMRLIGYSMTPEACLAL